MWEGKRRRERAQERAAGQRGREEEKRGAVGLRGILGSYGCDICFSPTFQLP